MCAQVFIPLFVWIDNLAKEEDVFCVAVNDGNHEWTIEFQNRGVLERHKCDSNAGGTCSRSSDLINIQGSLVHNLWQIVCSMM